MDGRIIKIIGSQALVSRGSRLVPSSPVDDIDDTLLEGSVSPVVISAIRIIIVAIPLFGLPLVSAIPV